MKNDMTISTAIPATISEVTVRPAHGCSAPLVQSDTPPPSRPRKRRTTSRDPSGSANGWPEWIVMRHRQGSRRTRASDVSRCYVLGSCRVLMFVRPI